MKTLEEVISGLETAHVLLEELQQLKSDYGDLVVAEEELDAAFDPGTPVYASEKRRLEEKFKEEEDRFNMRKVKAADLLLKCQRAIQALEGNTRRDRIG